MCIPFASFENILWLIKIWLSSFKWSVSFFQFVSIYIFLETAVSHALWNILIFKCSKNVLLHKIATISKECLKQFDKPSIIWGLFYCVYSLALYICTSSVFGTFVQSPWILLFPEIGIVLFPLKLVPSGHEEKNKISAITFRRNAVHKSPIFNECKTQSEQRFWICHENGCVKTNHSNDTPHLQPICEFQVRFSTKN